MKHLVKFNESLRDKMTPKTEEEINKLIKELSPMDIFQRGDWDDDEWMIKLALDKGLDLYTNNRAPLKAIVRQNRVNILKYILERGIDMNPTADFDPYHIAASNGWNKIIKLLIKHNVKITKRAVMTAHALDHITTYTLLKEYYDKQQMEQILNKANESLRDKMTPKSKEDIMGSLSNLPPYNKIKLGTLHGFPEIVEKGFKEIDKKSIKSSDVLNYIETAILGKNVEIVRLFLEYGGKSYALNTYLANIIQKHQNLDMVKLFHEYGADLDFLLKFPSIIDRYVINSETPTELIKYLIDNSPNIKSYIIEKYNKYDKLRKLYGNYIDEKITESVRDKMTPKSKDGMINALFDSSVNKDRPKIDNKIKKLVKLGIDEVVAFVQTLNFMFPESFLSDENEDNLYGLYKKGYNIFFYSVEDKDIDSEKEVIDMMKQVDWDLFEYNWVDVFCHFIFIKPPSINESVKDKMAPKTDSEITYNLFKKYSVKPEISKFLNEHGYRFAQAHETAWKDRWRTTLQFRNESENKNFYFVPGESLENIKKKMEK